MCNSFARAHSKCFLSICMWWALVPLVPAPAAPWWGPAVETGQGRSPLQLHGRCQPLHVRHRLAPRRLTGRGRSKLERGPSEPHCNWEVLFSMQTSFDSSPTCIVTRQSACCFRRRAACTPALARWAPAPARCRHTASPFGLDTSTHPSSEPRGWPARHPTRRRAGLGL